MKKPGTRCIKVVEWRGLIPQIPSPLAWFLYKPWAHGFWGYSKEHHHLYESACHLPSFAPHICLLLPPTTFHFTIQLDYDFILDFKVFTGKWCLPDCHRLSDSHKKLLPLRIWPNIGSWSGNKVALCFVLLENKLAPYTCLALSICIVIVM